MACWLFGSRPSSEPMLAYYESDHWAWIPVKILSKYKNFHTRKWNWKCLLNIKLVILLRSHCVNSAWSKERALRMPFVVFVKSLHNVITVFCAILVAIDTSGQRNIHRYKPTGTPYGRGSVYGWYSYPRLFAVGAMKWMINYISLFILDVMAYPCPSVNTV